MMYPLRANEHSRHSRLRRSKAAVLAVVCVCAIVSCTTDTTPPAPAPDPFATLDADAQIMTHRWIALPGIDLDSPELQVARAYLESDHNYWRTADLAATYPGFKDVREYVARKPVPRTGTIDHRILEVQATTVDGTPTTEVHVCSVFLNTGTLTNTGWVRMERLRYRALRIQRTGWNTATPPSLDYEHRIPYPTWNLFDGWDIHTFTDYRNDDGEPRAVCYYETSGIDEDTPVTARRPGPPVVEPFDPGWPTVVENEEPEK